MSIYYTISSRQYQTQIDRLNHLIRVQEIIVNLRRDNVISEGSFAERWVSHEYAIRSIFELLGRQGFIMLFSAKGKSHFILKKGQTPSSKR